MLAIGSPLGVVPTIIVRVLVVRVLIVMCVPTTDARLRTAVGVQIAVTHMRVRIMSARARPSGAVRATAQQRVQQQRSGSDYGQCGFHNTLKAEKRFTEHYDSAGSILRQAGNPG